MAALRPCKTITYRNWYLLKCKILRSNGVRIAGEQVVKWTRRDMVRETRQVGIVSRLGATGFASASSVISLHVAAVVNGVSV